MLSFLGHTDTGHFCDQQVKPSPKVHDLGKGRVCGRPELFQFPLGPNNLAVSTSPPSVSCAAGSGGAADGGDSDLPVLGTGFVVVSSLQDEATAYSEAPSLQNMSELPRFSFPKGRIQ